MRDDTAEWLAPMMEAAESRDWDAQFYRSLIRQASMPSAEVDWKALGKFDPAALAPEGLRMQGLDWIRFGELLREALGWHHYPRWPSGPPGACPAHGPDPEGA